MLEGDYETKEQELKNHLAKQNIMIKEEDLLELLKQKIREIQRNEEKTKPEDPEEERRLKEAQALEIEKYRIDGTRAIFHKVEPGTFMMVRELQILWGLRVLTALCAAVAGTALLTVASGGLNLVTSMWASAL